MYINMVAVKRNTPISETISSALFSFSNWSTDSDDVAVAIEAVRRASIQ